MNETNEKTNVFVKKGFLLDKESIDFFLKLDNLLIAEEILNKVYLITKSRIISRKTLLDHFEEIKTDFNLINASKPALIADFFNESSKVKEEVILKIEKKPFFSDIKILSSEVIPYRKIEVKDFITHFKNRYNLFKDVLKERKELENLVSINKIGNNRSFSIIGLVSSKRITKNKNIILEVEDLTGKISVLVNQDKENLTKKAREVVCDDVIGIKCSGSRDFIYANDFFFMDAFLHEKKRTDEEIYALFISDIHLGSKYFLKEKFEKFTDWINCKNIDDLIMAEKIKKIKYLFVAGDNVDGVGIYPGQEAFLEIKDMKEQYRLLADYFKKIPSHIKIIMCPGQHDAVRVPEPQPPLNEEFAEELTKMSNVFLVSNPALVEVAATEKKEGIKILFYHGASMIRNWVDEIEELRLSQAYLNPSKISKYMLRHRHLSPTHSSNVYIPSDKDDPMAIKEIPDILFTGDLHKADVDIYNNILIISGSCWQTATPFEEKVGNHPDPCKVPMLNLKSREIKILDFS